MINTDFLVVGGGIIGICLALELKRRYPRCGVTIIEKEKNCGYHASGRNSGVLHAGFYYDSDSLKARFTREGNHQMSHYCLHKGLEINRCGKLVVAQNERDLPIMDDLLERAMSNGVILDDISDSEAKIIEPRVKTYRRALFSPTTSSINPKQVITALVRDAAKAGIKIETNTAFITAKGQYITTTQGKIRTGYLINAAGLYADRIAHRYGLALEYRILPFKGIYLYCDNAANSLRTHIYPVPNLETPFLGVHFTISPTGHIKIGPTAIPVLWREQYQGFKRFSLNECTDILSRTVSLLIYNHDNFRKHALIEIKKYSKSSMINLAANLASGLGSKNNYIWGKSGIRAQLINIDKMKLENDFVCLPGKQSMHVLNAVSPGFTCALPFSSYVVDQVEKQINIQN